MGSALLSVGLRLRPEVHQQAIESTGQVGPEALCTYSVRSGLDLMLSTLQLEAGSEVLFSAVTIPDVPKILRAHGLVPVPIDIAPDSLAPRRDEVQARVGTKTRAVLLAHLFGGRIDLEDMVQLARQQGLLLWEDCAQAFMGDGYQGHPMADASFFSFGPIKSNTALGGALTRVKDPTLLDEMRRQQRKYKVEGQAAFASRILKYALIRLAQQPLPYALLARACSLNGVTPTDLLGGATRSYQGPMTLERFRQRPCASQLKLLARRLRCQPSEALQRRRARGEQLAALLPRQLQRPGSKMTPHSYWLFPICSRTPARLTRQLRSRGFEASLATTRLSAIPAAPGQVPATDAEHMMSQVLYLPVHEGLSENDVEELAQAVVDCLVDNAESGIP